MRMVMVSQLDLAGQMRGLVTTLHKQRALFMPVSAPIVYAKREDFGQLALGEIGGEQPAHSGYQAMLNETIEQGYARLIGT
jgi:hypothetical protein